MIYIGIANSTLSLESYSFYVSLIYVKWCLHSWSRFLGILLVPPSILSPPLASLHFVRYYTIFQLSFLAVEGNTYRSSYLFQAQFLLLICEVRSRMIRARLRSYRNSLLFRTSTRLSNLNRDRVTIALVFKTGSKRTCKLWSVALEKWGLFLLGWFCFIQGRAFHFRGLIKLTIWWLFKGSII